MARSTATTGVWKPDGEGRIVGLGATRTFLKDSKGMRHIEYLLARPGEEVSALDLVAMVEGTRGATARSTEPELSVGGLGDAGPALDEQAKRQYRRRLEEAQAELEEAELFNDPERADRARTEIDFIARELSAAVGLGGRDRSTGSASERARVNVTRAIKSALERIAEHDKPLARHLRATVRTGAFCTYEVDADDEVIWDFTEGAPVPESAADAPPVAPRRRPQVREARPHGLVERDAELAILDGALERTESGAGGLLILTGPMGIGKSALLSATDGRAAERGFTILRARGTEMERVFPYGMLRQLFDPALRVLEPGERTALLRGAVTPAAGILGYSETAPADASLEPGSPAAFDVLNAFFWLAAALAEAAPVVLLVDDAQWADPPTLAWLEFMVPRVAELPILMVVAERPAAEGDPQELLAQLERAPGVDVIAPGALSEQAVSASVRAAWPEASDRFCHAFHTASTGNPFYLREIVAAARAAGIEPTDEGAEQLRDVAPETVARLVLNRLRRLGPAAEQLARACAILGPHAELGVAAELAGLEDAQSVAAADDLAHEQILGHLRPLEFAHPMIRAVIEREIPVGARSKLHERVWELLVARGATAAEIAVHLLHSRPAGNPQAVEMLREAARQATVDGAPSWSAQLLERALAEPPPAEELPNVLLELGRALTETDRREEAAPYLERAMELSDDPRLEAEAVLELTRPLLDDIKGPLARLDRVIERVADLDRALTFQLEARAAELIVIAMGLTPSRELSREHDERLARAAASATGGTAGERQLLAMFAAERATQADIAADEARDMAMRALDDGVLMRRLAQGEWTCDSGVEVLSLVDAFDDADLRAREAERHARQRGMAGGEAYACMLRAVVAMHRGALLEAEALLGSVSAILEQAHHPYVEYQASQLYVCLCIDRSDLEGAERHCDVLARSRISAVGAPHARGLLHAARGEPELAVAELGAVLEMQRLEGRWRGVAMWPPGPDLVLALAATGQREEALELARDELELARSFGAPSAVGLALRAMARAEEDETALGILKDAARTTAHSQALGVRARVLCDLGAAQRRACSLAEARESLRQALAIAERSGALALAEQVRDELALAGAPALPVEPAGAELLTASERRVAGLAAQGATDREIAQSLFLKIQTVEQQVASALVKLEVKSRQDLAEALAEHAVAA